jgi:predicted negative regulator of RcsB-dependent stress response
LVVVIIAGWRLYSVWQERQVREASALYGQLETAIQAAEKDKVNAAYQGLRERYPRTIYASMAALVVAQQSFAKNDLASTRQALEWVAVHGRNEEMKATARLRWAGVLLDEKKYEEALKVLAAQAPASFAPLYADRRGDVYVEQQKLAEARKEFQAALAGLEPNTTLRRVVEIKLDALGEV